MGQKFQRNATDLSLSSQLFLNSVNIHDRLLNHCISNELISTKQAAYLKGDSTLSQLIYLVHNIRLAWGQKKIANTIFLDISAAFDKVWHAGLLAKLAQIGVEGNFHAIIKSYLENRRQRVVIEGEYSEELPIKAGIPQGSRLGPLLFIIYINDILKDLVMDYFSLMILALLQ